MQSGNSAAEPVKESAANATVSAKAGMEKAKATTQEKAERMTTIDKAEKEAATQRKEERKNQAQITKEEVHSHNEEVRRMAESGQPHPGYKTRGTEDYTTTGVSGAATAAATTDSEVPTLTGSTGDYATTPTGPATADHVYPREPVRADAPRFT